MDPIAGLLDGPRARRAFLLRCTLDPPWALHIRDEAPLSLVAMLRGRACFVLDGREPEWLDRGDVAILLGPDHYLFADDPATPPQAVIHPDQRCTTPDGQEIPQMRSFGMRRWGNAPDGATEILTGTYHAEGEVSRRLLDALPPRLVLRRDEWETPALGLLAAEMLRDEVGQDAVLDRLLDLLLIDAVRTYFARTEQTAPGWYRAQRDPVVGQAVRLLQESPAEAWTIGALATQTRVSRATLARRFAEVVGQPPMEFLTEWRLTLAADLILDPRETVGSVARAVGYSSPYALSAAFKRVRGVSPHEHRIAQRPVTAAGDLMIFGAGQGQGESETGRLEAFSDGVIAVIITIMALELRAPEGYTFASLRDRLPALLVYILSFTFIGIYWNNHHHLLRAARRITGGVMWANLHLLFWLSLIPVMTEWIGEHYAKPAPTATYAAVCLCSGVAFTILVRAIIRADGSSSLVATAIGSDLKGNVSLLGYAAATALAFVSTWISYVLIAAVTVMWFIPDRRLSQASADA